MDLAIVTNTCTQVIRYIRAQQCRHGFQNTMFAKVFFWTRPTAMPFITYFPLCIYEKERPGERTGRYKCRLCGLKRKKGIIETSRGKLLLFSLLPAVTAACATHPGEIYHHPMNNQYSSCCSHPLSLSLSSLSLEAVPEPELWAQSPWGAASLPRPGLGRSRSCAACWPGSPAQCAAVPPSPAINLMILSL